MTIYQHFSKDEYQFIDKILELKERAQTNYIPQLTHFLNPREQYIVLTLFSKKDDVQCYFFNDGERKRAIISYTKPEQDDFQVSTLQIDYPAKFTDLKHSQILGTILSSGIKREMIGDIITDGKNWQIFIAKQVEQFICQQITKISHISVQFYVTNVVLTNIQTNEQYKNELIVSTRLDVILASFFNVSRQVAKSIIESNHVLVNWKEMQKTDYHVQLYDTISVRKYGRLTIEQFAGQTKKGKLKVIAKLFKNKH